jgi:hypothetical protein
MLSFVVLANCLMLSKGNLDKWQKDSAVKAHKDAIHTNVIQTLLKDPALDNGAAGRSACPASIDCACFDLTSAPPAKFLHFGEKAEVSVCPACCSKKGLPKSTVKPAIKIINYCEDAGEIQRVVANLFHF